MNSDYLFLKIIRIFVLNNIIKMCLEHLFISICKLFSSHIKHKYHYFN